MGLRLHEFMLRVRALWIKRRLDQELAEELEFHQAMMGEKLAREGVSLERARAETRRAFGDAARWQERLRELWQFRWLEDLLRDAGFALRLLRRSPAFTAVALITLTLSVSATVAVFSLIDGLLLRPLPVPHANELVVVRYDSTDSSMAGVPDYVFPYPLFRGLEKRREIFPGGVGGYCVRDLQVRGSSGKVRISGAIVSGQYFSTLEVAPLLGRWLTPQDNQRGHYAAVISENFWKRWFDGTPQVIGRTLTIANVPFTVVGVMPRGFIGADPTDPPQIYMPLSIEPVLDAPYNRFADGIDAWWIRIIARRSPGMSLERTNAALAASSIAILRDGVSDTGWVKEARTNHFRFEAERGSKGWSWLRHMFAKPLIAVFILSAAMLLLACLNLASLLLARAAARERELATRLAIGASRRRLIQQLLVESLMLAMLGTAAGVAVSPLLSHFLSALLLGNNSGARLTTTLGTGADIRMILFALAVASVTALLIGLIPALRATSMSLNEQMKGGTHASQPHSRWLLTTLMGMEVALALMLVVGAGLLTASLIRLYRTGLGFNPGGLVNVNLEMGKQPRSGNALLQWYQEYAEALDHTPDVDSVSYEKATPLTGISLNLTIRTAAHPQNEVICMEWAGPRYFETMRIPMIAGREFRWDDSRKGEPVIILNQIAARLLFPGENAVGQQVTGWNKGLFRVIAVVGDVRSISVQKAPPPMAYLPMLTQEDSDKPSYIAVVRTSGPTAPLAAAARELAERMAPEIPAPVMTTMNSDLNESISSQRMMAILSVFFAVCALLVTAIGLYGTLAYATARRTTEIGIRMALGARRTQMIVLVFRGNAIVAACGSVVGLVAVLLASRTMTSFLYGTSVHDPWVLAGSALALALVASAASLIPAIRAARIEPMTAIRCE